MHRLPVGNQWGMLLLSRVKLLPAASALIVVEPIMLLFSSTNSTIFVTEESALPESESFLLLSVLSVLLSLLPLCESSGLVGVVSVLESEFPESLELGSLPLSVLLPSALFFTIATLKNEPLSPLIRLLLAELAN